MNATNKKISGVAYITVQASAASHEGPVSEKLAALFFGCAQVKGERTIEEWDEIVLKAKEHDVTPVDVIEFDEE